jgi:hypothetical protein
MYYKPDWEQAKKRIEAFWQNEVIDRCCIAVFAPRKTFKLPAFPELQWGPWLGGLESIPDDDKDSMRKWWTDPEANYRRLTTWFENTYFGGEAIPATYVNWGAMPLAAFFGSPAVFNKKSVWYPEVISDWSSWKWQFDQATNRYWQEILAINRCLIERCGGRYFIGSPEVGSAGDVLSLIRGMDKLCLDLMDNPEAVRQAITILTDTWIDLHEQLYAMGSEANSGAGILAWMSLWAPGRHAQVACDFSSIVSPRLFRDFFGEEIKREGNWCEYCTYHLDGPQAMRAQLPVLLSFDEIDMIEFTPGAGGAPTLSPQYIPLYKKIQEKGKRLYLLAKPEEIEPLLAELSPKGLFLSTQVPSKEEADNLLSSVARWSAGGNVFSVA